MEIQGYELTYPRLLLAALVIIVVLAGVIGLSTSSTAFGSYNPAWDGTSDVRALATNTGADTRIVRATTAYSQDGTANTTAFVLSPTESYSQTDVERIYSVVANGGTIVVASDFDSQANSLVDQLGVGARFDGRLIRDERDYYRAPDLPVASNIVDPALAPAVSQLTLNHGTAISPGANSQVLVNTSGFAYFDTNRDGELDETESLRERPVVVSEPVANGQVILVSDPSIFINAMLEAPDNRQFAEYLVSQSDTVLFDYSHRSGVPWAVGIVLIVADAPLLQLLVVVSITGISGVIWLSQRFDLPSEVFRSSGRTIDSGLSEAEVVDHITAHHPDWDDERIGRVARGIISRASNEREDD